MTERPDYKSHPLWSAAMALTRDAYAIAERLRERSPETTKRLRKAAVSVPAHIASALSCAPDLRAEHMYAARGALAEISRQAARADIDGCEGLARRAEDLDRLVLFEFGTAEAVS
jgi:four helix bundle protein